MAADWGLFPSLIAHHDGCIQSASNARDFDENQWPQLASAVPPSLSVAFSAKGRPVAVETAGLAGAAADHFHARPSGAWAGQGFIVDSRPGAPRSRRIEQERVMGKHSVTWFVVADGASARLLSRGEDGFAAVSAITSIDARHESSDLGSERPGRTIESGGSGRHAIQPRSDLHEQAKLDFARATAETVNEAAKHGAFDRLVLVALPKTLHAIKLGLDDPALARLVAEHPHDLVKLPEGELRDRLSAIDLHHG
jgi:protein required for attachment to host cells